MFHQIILKSSQVLWFIKYVSYISVLYSVPNATLYHSRGRGSLTSFWCGCSFYVGNVSSLFRFMSHCLHCQKLFKIFFISSFISKAYQKNWKNWKNVVANTSTKPRLYQGTQPVFSPLLLASVFARDDTTKNNHIVHWMYVAAACHLFVQSSVHVLLFLWPGLDPSRRH